MGRGVASVGGCVNEWGDWVCVSGWADERMVRWVGEWAGGWTGGAG